ENGAILQFVPTAEGFFSFRENRYIYQYKDHLGNVRLSYANSNNILEIVDKNDYYPFGMNFLDSNNNSNFGQSSYKNYKYNSKELQETGMYDYGARFYMPDIGRWGVIDPLAEKDRRWSPYRYAYNNPLRFMIMFQS
ncbi:MAG: RHS repeat-associated core domain-containing protein, partial [Flavobacteriaceae bacterium]|nr:RHS repeat-associated core domain-containing protein [Flavobacteriaceae bacterium]